MPVVPPICLPFLPESAALSPQFLPSVFDSIGVARHSLMGSWLGFSLVALLATASAIIIAYLVSQLLRNAKLEAWSKFEFFQVLATAGLAMLIAGHVWAMCTWDVSIFDKERYTPANYPDCAATVNGKAVITPYCVASDFLEDIKKRGEDIFQILLAVNYGFHYLFKSVWENRAVGMGYTAEPLGGVLQLQNLFLIGIMGFMVSYLSIIVQQRVLEYFLLSMPFFFMPLGIVLRSFTPTREFGGTLMAIAYSSVFFYPLTIAMNDMVVFSDMKGFTGTSEQQFISEFEAYTRDASGASTLWQQGVQTPNGGMLDPMKGGDYINKGMWGSFRGIAAASGLPSNKETEQLTYFMFWPWRMIMIYFIAAVMLPIINFIIYVEIARNTSRIFGSEVDLTNLTRLI